MVLSKYIYTYAVILLTVFSCSAQENPNFPDLKKYTQINSSNINYLDNVLYKKIGNKYYKRKYNGVIYLKWYYDKFNGDGDKMIEEAVKVASPNDVIIIEGELRLKKTLIIDKTITLAGNSFVNSNDTHSANNSRIYFSVPLNVGIQAKSINLMNLTIAGNDLSNKIGVNAVGSVVLQNVTIQMFDTGLIVKEGYYNKFQNSFITYCTTNLILDKCYNSNAFGVSFSTTPNSTKSSTNIILKNKTNLNLFGCSVESFNNYGVDLYSGSRLNSYSTYFEGQQKGNQISSCINLGEETIVSITSNHVYLTKGTASSFINVHDNIKNYSIMSKNNYFEDSDSKSSSVIVYKINSKNLENVVDISGDSFKNRSYSKYSTLNQNGKSLNTKKISIRE